MKANWWTVATINSQAAEARLRDDWEAYKDLMRLRERVISQIKIDGIYEVTFP